MEGQPPPVPGETGAKQGGEVRARWAWTEPSVWTDRMLTALETGVEGGVWFSLMDKVWSRANLESAFAKVRSNRGGAGVDRVTVAMFGAHREAELTRLQEQLRTGAYAPQAHAARPDAVDEPQHAVLACKKILHTFGIKPRAWRSGLPSLLDRYYRHG